MAESVLEITFPPTVMLFLICRSCACPATVNSRTRSQEKWREIGVSMFRSFRILREFVWVVHSAGATAKRQVSATRLTVRDDRDSLLNAPPVQRGGNRVKIGSLGIREFSEFSPPARFSTVRLTLISPTPGGSPPSASPN